MSDESKILTPDTKILSIGEARAEAHADSSAMGMGARGLKRFCSRQEVQETALGIAVEISRQTYELVAKEHAEQMSKLEAMCLQHVAKEVEAIRAEIEARTVRGRVRQLWAWWSAKRMGWAARREQMRASWVYLQRSRDDGGW